MPHDPELHPERRKSVLDYLLSLIRKVRQRLYSRIGRAAGGRNRPGTLVISGVTVRSGRERSPSPRLAPRPDAEPKTPYSLHHTSGTFKLDGRTVSWTVYGKPNLQPDFAPERNAWQNMHDGLMLGAVGTMVAGIIISIATGGWGWLAAGFALAVALAVTAFSIVPDGDDLRTPDWSTVPPENHPRSRGGYDPYSPNDADASDEVPARSDTDDSDDDSDEEPASNSSTDDSDDDSEPDDPEEEDSTSTDRAMARPRNDPDSPEEGNSFPSIVLGILIVGGQAPPPKDPQNTPDEREQGGPIRDVNPGYIDPAPEALELDLEFVVSVEALPDFGLSDPTPM